MLALSLMPSLSRAVAHWRGDDAVREVCSTTRLFASNDRPADSSDATLHALGHCPYCALATAALAPPPAEPAPVPQPMLRHAAPDAAPAALPAAGHWRIAQSRGPPTALS